MKDQIGILILHGDGSSVRRLTVPRWLLYGGIALFSLAAGCMAGFSGEFLFLKAQSGRLATMLRQARAEKAVIALYQRRVAAIGSEIDSWKALHAKMWAPYGPEGAQTQEPTGVGGPAPVLQTAAAADGATALGQELDRLTTSVKEESPRLRELEQVMAKSARIMAALPLAWPVRGPVNSEFGLRDNPWGLPAKEHHEGIDIGVPYGDPVKAPAPGVVVLAGPRGDYGNSVTLEHGHDVRSTYGHLSRILVKAGDHVAKGQVLGLAGSTGRSTGPHLHYEVSVKGRPVNPRSFLWE
jgi:murein DD-endopeptidase MepM/ murein hydrolase activator NlpD